MAHKEKKKAKGLPRRYGSPGRSAKRARYFIRHGKTYTGR